MTDKRIFVGAFTYHPDLDDLFEQAKNYLEPTGRLKWTRTTLNLHITFHFFGKMPIDKIIKIQEILKDINPKYSDLKCNVNGLDFFSKKGKPSVLYAKVDDYTGKLVNYYSTLQQQLYENNLIEKTGNFFIPHITFGRIKSVKNDFYKDINIFNEQLTDINILNLKPVIIESILSPQGALYQELKEF
jgi:2'-5' RNA ligase